MRGEVGALAETGALLRLAAISLRSDPPFPLTQPCTQLEQRARYRAGVA